MEKGRSIAIVVLVKMEWTAYSGGPPIKQDGSILIRAQKIRNARYRNAAVLWFWISGWNFQEAGAEAHGPEVLGRNDVICRQGRLH